VAIELVDEAACAGARRSQACSVLGLSLRTLQRWQSESEPDLASHDRRKGSTRSVAHRLSEAERSEILNVCNQPRFASLPPSQIVPALADEGVYLASESSFYRILRAEDQLHHRGRSAPSTPASPPQWVASGPRQIWSWDITFLPSAIRGQFHLLYLVMDVYSRKIVGWEVHDSESAQLASEVLQRAYLAEGIAGQDLTLHSDNGASMKGATMLATLQKLGVVPSFSRPGVSNDNPYSEALFRTLKYRPSYPSKPFASLEEARLWVQQFVLWYNDHHRHSRLKFVTPRQRHRGEDEQIRQQRRVVYQQAKQNNPLRWSGNIRNWEVPNQVYLNPPHSKNVTEEVRLPKAA
jgi:putative transposase